MQADLQGPESITVSFHWNSGGRREAGRPRSSVEAQEYRSEQSWPIGKSLSAGTSSKRLVFLACAAIAAFLEIYTVILFIADVS